MFLDDLAMGESLSTERAVDILTSTALALSAHEANGTRYPDLHPLHLSIEADERRIRVDLDDLPRDARPTAWWAAPEFMKETPTPLAPCAAIFPLGMLGFELLSRVPFLTFVRAWSGERHPVWPDSLESYLKASPSPFEDAVLSAPSVTWRDPGGHSARARLLTWIFSTTRFDPQRRAGDLTRTLGPASECFPVAASVAWLRNLRFSLDRRSHSFAA